MSADVCPKCHEQQMRGGECWACNHSIDEHNLKNEYLSACDLNDYLRTKNLQLREALSEAREIMLLIVGDNWPAEGRIEQWLSQWKHLLEKEEGK